MPLALALGFAPDRTDVDAVLRPGGVGGAPGQSAERVVPRGVVWGGKHKDDVVPGDENSGVFLILGLKRQEEEGQDVTRTAGQSPCLERAA